MSNESHTYQELAEHWGITLAATKQRVRRANWKRIKGNDGTIKIIVPKDTDRILQSVSHDKTSENKALDALRDTLRTLTEATDKQSQRIENLTTALLASQEENASLREKISALEALQTAYQKDNISYPRKGIIHRVLRVLYAGGT
nr:hypothetical protein [Neokomagataea thailandica]